jgi:predicted metalloprotease with PDZ domain
MSTFLLGAALAAPVYTLSFEQRNASTLTVEAAMPADADELMMAVWTPGSYLLREFAQHVSRVEATRDGVPLPVRKVRKNHWQIDAGGKAYTLRYEVYAHDAHVRGNWIDDEYAVLNGAATYLVPIDTDGPFDVRVDRPDGWARTVTPLPARDDHFHARDLDQLLDSPILVGNPRVTTFSVGGVPHRLVDLPAESSWDSRRAVDDLTRIVEQNRQLWGELPYEQYHFFNWIGEGSGGLEHADSTLMMSSRRTGRDDEAYTRWLGLAAHEHFHTWNAKRLHPRGLGPFDYEQEVYTPDLWIVEGITSYYDDLVLARSGLVTRERYLALLARGLEQLADTPGRQVMSLEEASRDAWIKHYRPSENSANTRVSYYRKGALVAWALDARIRAVTNGRASLDDVLRLAWERLRGRPGYTTDAFLDLIDEVAGQPMRPFLDPLVRGTAELDHDAAAAVFGLATGTEARRPEPWLGVDHRRGRIVRIRADGPAWDAPLAVGDEILAIDGERDRDDPLSPLAQHRPGDAVTVLYARRGRVRETRVVLGSTPRRIQLQVVDGSRKQERARVAWLTGAR